MLTPPICAPTPFGDTAAPEPIELFDAAEIHGFVGHSPAMRRLMAKRQAASVISVRAQREIDAAQLDPPREAIRRIRRAGETDVVVVGTRFSVDYGDGHGPVEVEVEEGAVRVVRGATAARVAAGLDIPGCVRVLDIGADDQCAWVVEESLEDSRSVADLLHSGGLPGDEVRLVDAPMSGVRDAIMRRAR